MPQAYATSALCLVMLVMLHNEGMDVVQVLQELAKHPLADEAFAKAARALVLLSGAAPPSSSPPAVALPAALPVERPAAGRLAPPARREDPNVRFTVKDADGHRTTLSLPRGFRDAAAHRLGGPAKLAELVRLLSRQAPRESTNRSGWVQDRIQERLQSQKDTRTPDLFETR